VTEQQDGPENGVEPKDVGNQLMRMVAWFAVAAVAILVIALGFLVLRAMGIF
jgi:ATP/ADP translocase